MYHARMAKRPAQPDPAPESGFLQGTLDVLILRTLESHGPLHGYAIARRIEDTSGAQWKVEEGSLYPALRRLEQRADVEAEWGPSDTGRRARIYSLTRAGRQRLAAAKRDWASLAQTMHAFLGLGPRPVRAAGEAAS